LKVRVAETSRNYNSVALYQRVRRKKKNFSLVKIYLIFPWHRPCKSARLHRQEQIEGGGAGVMEHSDLYSPIGGGRTGPSPAYFYMIDSLLDCRKESRYPSNSEFYDEDVNVYLASLLTSQIFGPCAGSSDEMIVPYDIHLFDSAAREADPRRRFDLYRSNADNLLLKIGLFGNPAGRRPGSAPHMALAGGAWIGRGKAYYRLAWSCAAETFRRPTAIGDVMGKLSKGFERYVEILSAMRSACFNMIPTISDGEMFHLERSVLDEEGRSRIPTLYDDFLDAWTAYRRSRGTSERRRLERAAEMLEEADPSFSFDPFSDDTL
jgi:hypothetical protein